MLKAKSSDICRSKTGFYSILRYANDVAKGEKQAKRLEVKYTSASLQCWFCGLID